MTEPKADEHLEASVPDVREDVPALLAENARLKAVLAGIADRWDSCLSEERRGSMDNYDGMERLCKRTHPRWRFAREPLRLKENLLRAGRQNQPEEEGPAVLPMMRGG